MTCSITYAKEEEARKKSELNRIENQLKREKKLSAEILYTEELVHKYIRKRDHGKPCISCGASWRSDFQAGHRFSKKQYNGIRFDLMNIHAQCPQCNLYKDGNYDEYHFRLPNRISMLSYEKLQKRAEIAFKIPHTFTRHELKEIQSNVKKLLSELQ